MSMRARPSHAVGGSMPSSLPWNRCESTKRREQVVRGGDGVEIAVQVQVDLFRWALSALKPPPAAPPFMPKTGPKRRLARGDDGALTDALKTLYEADGGDGFAFAGDGGGSGGDQDELALGVEARIIEESQVKLGAEGLRFS